MEHALGIKNLKPWKAGESGNPSGRPRIPEELRAIQPLTRPIVTRIISKYGHMNREQLEIAFADPSTSAMDLAIIGVFMKCIQHGDPSRLTFLLDQSIGKVPNTVENDDELRARAELEALSEAELVRIVKEKLPELESEK